MKINQQVSNQIKLSPISYIRKFYLEGKIRLKTLLSDVFTKTKKDGGQTMLHDGDKFQHEYIKTREVPNCISTSNDVAGVKLKKALYFPEDIEKMEKMTVEERREYKKLLKKEGKFYYRNEGP